MFYWVLHYTLIVTRWWSCRNALWVARTTNIYHIHLKRQGCLHCTTLRHAGMRCELFFHIMFLYILVIYIVIILHSIRPMSVVVRELLVMIMDPVMFVAMVMAGTSPGLADLEQVRRLGWDRQSEGGKGAEEPSHFGKVSKQISGVLFSIRNRGFWMVYRWSRWKTVCIVFFFFFSFENNDQMDVEYQDEFKMYVSSNHTIPEQKALGGRRRRWPLAKFLLFFFGIFEVWAHDLKR